MGPASVAAINKMDRGRMMAELVSLSMQHYTVVAAAERASPDEAESWMRRAATRGV
jgi:hypothetical protein